MSRDWVADCVEIMHEAYAAVRMYLFIHHVSCDYHVISRMQWCLWEVVIRQVK